MLKNNYDVELSPFDLLIFDTLVPQDHYLRQLKAAIDFSTLRALVADCIPQIKGAVQLIRFNYSK